MTLAGFIQHIATANARIAHSTHKALEQAAKVVEHEAKKSIGHYQLAAGPFGPWPELKQATKDDRLRKNFTENDPGLRTGAMMRSINHLVGNKEAVVGSNDQHLVWFELGTNKQFPRSVLGGAAFRKQHKVASILGSSVAQGLIGNGVHNGYLPIK